MRDFDLAINDYERSMPEMSVSQSLFIMETFFNNVIVAKQEIREDAEIYDKQSFEFSLPVDNAGNIKGDLIRNGYRDFVDTILSRMNGYNLIIADMFVKEISSNSVTFGLEMEPYNQIPPIDEIFIGAREVKHTSDPIGVPSGVTSRWDNMNNLEMERVVHKYSFKRYISMYTKVRTLGYDPHVYGIICYTHRTTNVGDQVIWNSDDLNNDIIPSVIWKVRQKFNEWKFPNTNQVLVNYNPYISKELNKTIPNENGIGNRRSDEYKLNFSYVIVAEPSSLSFEELHYTPSAVVNRPPVF